jgi:hypothetical protein
VEDEGQSHYVVFCLSLSVCLSPSTVMPCLGVVLLLSLSLSLSLSPSLSSSSSSSSSSSLFELLMSLFGLSVKFLVRLSLYPSLSIYLSIYLSICLSVYLSISRSYVCLVYASRHLFALCCLFANETVQARSEVSQCLFLGVDCAPFALAVLAAAGLVLCRESAVRTAPLS